MRIKCVLTAIFDGVDICSSLGVICYTRWVLSEGHKNYFNDYCLINSQHTFLIFTSFNSMKWPHCQLKPVNFESNNSVKLSSINIWSLCSNFVECQPFLETNTLEILALCETTTDDWIDSGNFSVRGYLHLIQKDYDIHMHHLIVYLKEGLPFARDLSLENFTDSYLCFRLALLHSVSFSSVDYLLCLYACFLMLFYLT